MRGRQKGKPLFLEFSERLNTGHLQERTGVLCHKGEKTANALLACQAGSVWWRSGSTKGVVKAPICNKPHIPVPSCGIRPGLRRRTAKVAGETAPVHQEEAEELGIQMISVNT